MASEKLLNVVASDAPLAVEDASNDPRVAGNLAISELGVSAYLGVPVHGPEGETLGSLCAISSQPRHWTEDTLSRLQSLAAIIEAELRLRAHADRAANLAHENAVLAREYHHRVKNALAVSASLVSLTGREATSVKDLVEKASARFRALAEAHGSLAAGSDVVDLKDLATRLLLPYCLPGALADVDGPSVEIRQSQVTPICFFLHELATNSAKYGAFRDGGEVKVRWAQMPEDMLSLVWEERSKSIKGSSKLGFGSALVQVAAAQLEGNVKTDWNDGRLIATLDFPQR